MIILVAPIFWFTRVDLGGLGFSPFEISMFLGAAGMSQALWILIAFPPLQHRIGSGGVLRICAMVWPFSFAIWPICNIFLRHHWNATFWTVAIGGNIIGCGVSMAFSKLIIPSSIFHY
jgi:hypothetical protein